MRVLDVIQGVAYLRARSDIDGDRVGVVGTGAGGLLALYAGALDEQVRYVAVHRGLYAYRALISRPFYSHHFSLLLPGVLRAYDLGDVAGLVAPRPLLLVNPVDEGDQPTDSVAVETEYRIARQVYCALRSPGKLTVVHTGTAVGPVDTVGRWISNAMDPN